MHRAPGHATCTHFIFSCPGRASSVWRAQGPCSPCLLQLSNSARAPSVWRALGPPDLYPLQLSCHIIIYMESPRTSEPAHCLSSGCSAREHRALQDTIAHTHFNSSYPVRVPSAHRALGLPGLHPPQLKLSYQGVLCIYNHSTPTPNHPAYTHFSFNFPAKAPAVWRAQLLLILTCTYFSFNCPPRAYST